VAFVQVPDESEIGTDLTLALDDIKNVDEANQDATEHYGVVGFIEERFQKSKTRKYTDEQRALKAYRNYRGIYGPDVQFTETEKSRVFVKVTKAKVLAAYGQITDVLFTNSRFPIGIDPTPVPEGIKDAVHIDPKEPDDYGESLEDGGADATDSPYGYPGDGKEIPKGATLKDLIGNFFAKKLDKQKVKDGPGQTPSAITVYPAMVAAKKMEKKIYDQLDESGAPKHLRSAILEMVLFGTGIIKGPFAYDKESPKWGEDGKYDPVVKTVPKIEHVSFWALYPDPDAISMEDAEYVIQRHKMSRTQLRSLKKRPMFRDEVIEAVIENGTNYTKEWWEEALTDRKSAQLPDRWEVYEYWGMLDKDLAEEAGLDMPKEYKDKDQVQVNAWICGGNILRLVLNPFTPARIPYYCSPYEHNPYSFFGVGLAENMEDTQTLMNGFMRIAVDNAVLSSSVVFEIDETNLVPGQDLHIHPGKIFRRQGGAPGQALFSTKFQNTTQENLQMFDKARTLADEATGIQSYSYGQSGVGGMSRTSSGMSMLMSAASSVIKTVIKNVDDHLLCPLGQALFAFNMQFDYDPDIKGDLDIRAKGTESLMKNEVRSQRLLTFLQVGSGNPALAPHMKFPYIIREIATTLELDPDKVTNNPDEAMLQAMLMQKMGSQPQMGMQGAPSPGSPPGANPMDPTGSGGGNIGTGAAPMPGEQGFAATKGPPGPPPQQGNPQ